MGHGMDRGALEVAVDPVLVHGEGRDGADRIPAANGTRISRTIWPSRAPVWPCWPVVDINRWTQRGVRTTPMMLESATLKITPDHVAPELS